MRSSARPSRIETQDSQRSHGSPSWRFVQLTALARIRASEVLPVPRGPTKRTACDDPVGPDGVAERLDDGLLADDLGEGLGAPAAVERLVRDGRASGLGRCHGLLVARAGERKRIAVHPPSILDVSRPP